MKILKSFLTVIFLSFFIVSCGNKENKPTEQQEPKKEEKAEVSPENNKGVGPIKSVELGDIDQSMATEGEELFKTKCTACHKIEKRFVGPALKGVTERRTPEWIMNMILNPEKMVAEDPTAQELLAEYLSPMANQSLNEEEARKILEYFRTQI